jgi:hypothetical protein
LYTQQIAQYIIGVLGGTSLVLVYTEVVGIAGFCKIPNILSGSSSQIPGFSNIYRIHSLVKASVYTSLNKGQNSCLVIETIPALFCIRQFKALE